MNKTIRIGLADTSEKNRAAWKAILQQVVNYQIIFEAINGQELIKKLRQQSADIVLINFQMPIMNGTRAIQNLKFHFPDLRIVLMALYNNPLLLWNYMNMGVNGMVLKQFKVTQIQQTIDGVIQKGYHCSETILKSISSIQTKQVKTKEPIQFTETELEIIKCLCNEMTSVEMGQQLFLSHRTIDWHRKEIKKKLGVKSTIGIVKYAISNGIFSL